MMQDEMKNLDEIEQKTMIQEKKIRPERIKNSLDEFEMNALEITINAEIEILKNEEKTIRNIITSLKKSKPELLDVYTKKATYTNCFKKSEYEYKIYRSVKNLEKELEK